jgi:hypothetical protein
MRNVRIAGERNRRLSAETRLPHTSQRGVFNKGPAESPSMKRPLMERDINNERMS